MFKHLYAFCLSLALLVSGAAWATEEWDQIGYDMQFVREEEKLARDVYATLYDYFFSQGSTLSVFNNIAYSEQKHMDAMLKLLAKYGIPDSAEGGGQGDYPQSCRETNCLFNNVDLKALYPKLIKDGKDSSLAAFVVGAYIEELDISDLGDAIKNAEGYPEIQAVYENLLCGSGNHLRAFAKNIELLGYSYFEATDKYLASIRPKEGSEEYDDYMEAVEAILNGDMAHCGNGGGKGPKGPKGPQDPKSPKGPKGP